MYVPRIDVLTRTHLVRHQRERQGTPIFRLAYHDLQYLASYPYVRGVHSRTARPWGILGYPESTAPTRGATVCRKMHFQEQTP